MMRWPLHLTIAAVCTAGSAAEATQAKIDADTCTQLRLEQIKFRQSGILDDMGKGPDWAKANLTGERLRDIEHYVALDEQVKFGCRDAKLSPEAEKASEAAERIEINSDIDPTLPVTAEPTDGTGTAPATGEASKLPAKKAAAKKTSHKKPKGTSPDAQNTGAPQKAAKAVAADGAAPAGSIAAPSIAPAAAPAVGVGAATGAVAPGSPALGFGDMAPVPDPPR